MATERRSLTSRDQAAVLLKACCHRVSGRQAFIIAHGDPVGSRPRRPPPSGL